MEKTNKKGKVQEDSSLFSKRRRTFPVSTPTKIHTCTHVYIPSSSFYVCVDQEEEETERKGMEAKGEKNEREKRDRDERASKQGRGTRVRRWGKRERGGM